MAAHGTRPTVRIRVLGSVAASTDDGEIALGGPRPRALLAALVHARGRIRSHDVLLHEVWGDATPGLRSALRANISRLRATPLGPFLTGTRQGYALVGGAHLDVDLWHLDHLADGTRAPSPEALAHLTASIEVAPFDGIGHPPFAAKARAEAQRMLRRALVRAIDADPGHPLAVSTVERLLARSPDDPELRALRLASHEVREPDAPSVTTDPRGAAPATATRRVGVPAPIAAYHPRPEIESRLAAALRLSRLVTLVGPSGAGKTRLAVEWARGRGGAGQEHIWFCRADGGPNGWLRALALAVGADDASVTAIGSRLHALRGTIVLDGLDEAADAAAPVVVTLLEQAAGVTALVTARRPLDVPGESVQFVGALGTADARALFLLRAGMAPPLDPTDVDALISALGGLPLAIELAAARASHLPSAAVLDALVGADQGGRGEGPLERALAATMALLTPSQRETLSRLGVFRGPFALESAVARGGPAAERDLPALIGWSLVTDESPGAATLLRVPEVVRRHVAVPRTGAGIDGGIDGEPAFGTGAARDAEATWHREWFAARTLAAFDELTTSEAVAAWQRLDAERADIDAAFDDAVRAGDRASALAIAAGQTWAALRSGTQPAILALARRADAVTGDAPAGVEARASIGRGILSYQLGFMAEAASALQHALAQATAAGEPDLIAQSHAFLAYLATLTPGGTAAAVRDLRSAQALLEPASPSTRAMVALISAQVERALGERERALRDAASAGALAERAGHAWVALMSGVVAAKVRLDAREPRDALRMLRVVLEDPRTIADPISVLITVSVAAGAAAAVGADAAGARIIGAVDAIGPRYGFDPRANEPADFDRYRRRVREGLTADAWADAYARGAGASLAELVDLAVALAPRPTPNAGSGEFNETDRPSAAAWSD